MRETDCERGTIYAPERKAEMFSRELSEAETANMFQLTRDCGLSPLQRQVTCIRLAG